MSNSSSQGTPPSGENSPPEKKTPPSPNEDNSSSGSPSGSTPPSPTSNTPPPSPNSNTPPSPSSSSAPPSPSSDSTLPSPSSSPPPSPSSSSPPPSPSSDSPPPSTSSNSSPPSPSSKSTPPSPNSKSTPPSPTSPSPSSNSAQPSPSSNFPPPPPSSNSSQPSPSSKSPPPSSNSNSSEPLPSSSPPTPSSNPPPPPTSSNSPPPSSSGSSPPLASQGNNSPPPPSEPNSPPTQNTTPPSPPPNITSPPSEFQPPGPPKNFSPPPSLPSPNDLSSNSKPSPTAKSQTHSNSATDSSSSSATPNSSSNISVTIGIGVAFVVIVLVGISFVLTRRKKKRSDGLDYRPPARFSVMTDGYRQANLMGASTRSNQYYSSGPQSGPLGVMNGSSRYGYPSGSQSCFSYEEMMDVTNGFSPENLIGEGGFGCVYKGCLQDGRKVAVKQLKAGSGQGEREFRAEVEIISRVHHRHLVSLVGYCIAESHRLLVYEFLPNNTLEHHLHGLPVMEWPKRVKIAVGSAKGLAYLHEDCHPRIIHRDIKSANILLEDSFEPQVADFGLAKLSNDTHTHVSTRVMGTFGYMAPEYASSGKLTDRSDVFSFGVVLLELITARKPVDTTQPLGDESLVEWARPLLVHALETGNCEELVDPRLENNYNKSEMLRMIEVAAACVRHSAPKRPRMSQVVRALDTEDDMTDLTNGVRIGQSQAFNSDVQRFRRMAFGSSGNHSFDYDSGDYDRRSTAYSGELRSREQRPPGGRRSGDQSSQSSGNHESDTRAMFRSERSTGGGSFRHSGRGFY